MPYMMVHDKEKNQWCIHEKGEDGNPGKNRGCSDSEEMAKKHMQALYVHHGELSPNSGNDLILELSPMTAMKSGFPEIPFAEGLKAEDFIVEEVTGYSEENGAKTPITTQRKPTFVTLQIAEVGRKSEKGIYYDEELVNGIVDQINRKRPGGIFGHVDPSQPFAMPDPEIMWVGAKLDGKTAWAKGWVREPKAEKRVIDIKRVGGTLGTSIWGIPEKRVVENQAVRLKNFTLHRLDLADDVERASLQMNGAFRVTAELNDGNEEETVDKTTVSEFLKTLKPTQILELLGEQKGVVSEMLVEQAELSANATVVAELIGARDDALTQVAELKTNLETANKVIAEFKAEKTEERVRDALRQATPWNVTTESGKALYKAMHEDLLYPSVVEELASGKELGQAIAAVMELKRVSVDSYRKQIAGNRLAPGGNDNRIPMFGTEFTDEQREKARNETGIRFH